LNTERDRHKEEVEELGRNVNVLAMKLRPVGVYIVMVGTKYRPYLCWTDCNLKVEVDPG
jgi:hypothetical protein